MKVYLASPNTQQQAEHCANMPVLLSFGSYSKWLDQYHPSFSHVLIDSGAYAELNGSKKIDIEAYKDFSKDWIKHADAIAGLDDIKGDYNRSLKNYHLIPWSFPTWHDTDPLQLIPVLVSIATERKTWIGIGLMPPRQNKERIIREALELIPENIHIHGWALREYTFIRRLNSVDSTNWWRDAMSIRKSLPWLHYGEALDIVIKKYIRWQRVIKEEELSLFDSQEKDLF